MPSIAQHVITTPIFEDDWGANEEQALMEAIDSVGLGNWFDISKQLVTKTIKQCEEHYERVYLANGPEGPPACLLTVSALYNVRWFAGVVFVVLLLHLKEPAIFCHHVCVSCVPVFSVFSHIDFVRSAMCQHHSPVFLPDMSCRIFAFPSPLFSPFFLAIFQGKKLDPEAEQKRREAVEAAEKAEKAREEEESKVKPVKPKPGNKGIVGYMPLRGDFEQEWDNDFEQKYLFDMEFEENEDPIVRGE